MYKAPSGSEFHTGNRGQLTSLKTRGGTEARFGADGRVRSIHSGAMVINHAPRGGRMVEAHLSGGGRVVVVGAHRGFVERPFERGGRPYLRRTYLYGDRPYAVVYRGYHYHGLAFFGYVPPVYYGPAFYGWAYNPWLAPVSWTWGWAAAPWYGYSRSYFVPFPVYPSPALWLTDFLLAESLRAAYEAPAAANAQAAAPTGATTSTVAVAGAQPFTDMGIDLAAGESIQIRASGSLYIGAIVAAPQYDHESPAGCPVPTCRPYVNPANVFPVSGAPFWSLIGRIGQDGPPFEVGAATSFTAPTAGRLYLGVNDNNVSDNSGSWMATITTGPNVLAAADAPTAAANAQASVAEAQVGDGVPSEPARHGELASASALTPEVKQAIGEEVRAQLAAEQAVANNPQAAVAPSQEQVPEALDPKVRTLIVSNTLSQQTPDGMTCSLSSGDVLTRIANTPDANQNVEVLVTSSQNNDCQPGTQLALPLQELQDMHNDFRQKIDAGLQTLADNQGKNGIPSGPPAEPKPVEEGLAQPDADAPVQLDQQLQDADKAEAEVQQSM